MSASPPLRLSRRILAGRAGIAEDRAIRDRAESRREASGGLEEVLREIVLIAHADEADADALDLRGEGPGPQHRPRASGVGGEVQMAHDPTSVRDGEARGAAG